MKTLRLGKTQEGSREFGGVGVPVELVGDLLCATADGIEDICDLMREMNTKLDRMVEAVEKGTEKANESLEAAVAMRSTIEAAGVATEKLVGSLRGRIGAPTTRRRSIHRLAARARQHAASRHEAWNPRCNGLL